MNERPPPFLTLPEVAEEFAASLAQISALVRRGDLAAIKLGGRGTWRIERSKPGGTCRSRGQMRAPDEDTACEMAERRGARDEDPDDEG